MAKDIEVYTLAEVADILQITRRTIYNWVKSGKLKTFKAGRSWRVTREALEEFTKAGTQEE